MSVEPTRTASTNAAVGSATVGGMAVGGAAAGSTAADGAALGGTAAGSTAAGGAALGGAAADEAPPTLVLLPGLDGTGDFFDPLLESFGESVRSRVVRYPMDGAYDYATCQELARAALPTDGPYVLLGESFSGPIAISLAAEAPKGLVGIILCATFASNPRPRLAFIRPLLPYIPYHGTKSSASLSRFLVLGRWITPRVRELHLKILSTVPPKTMRARIEAVADCDVREALGRVRVPILCLVAKHDRLIPRAAARAIQRRAPAAQVVELDAPHCLLQCVPGMAAGKIREFLEALA